MGFLDGVGIRAVDACRSKHTHAASAVGVNDVDSTLMDSDTRSPSIVGVIPKFAFGAENHAVVGPVFHVLGRKCIKAHDIVVVILLGTVVIHIGQDVEGTIVGCSRRVCQVMVS